MTQYIGMVVFQDIRWVDGRDEWNERLKFAKEPTKSTFEEALEDAKKIFDAMRSEFSAKHNAEYEDESITHLTPRPLFYAAVPFEDGLPIDEFWDD